MKIIELNKKLYSIPTEWNELSQKQLLEVMDCLFMQQYTAEQGQLKLLKILTGMSFFDFFRTRAMDMDDYLYLTEFLLKDQKGLTKQLILEYDGLFGPSDELGNLVMQELVFSDSYFQQWSEHKEDLVMLDKLVAVLYRPAKEGYEFDKDPDGDAREEYNQNLCNWRALHQVKNWPLNVKLAIAAWYDACRWKIVDDNEEVFGGSSSGEMAQYGLISVIRRVAQGGVLGDFNSVEKKYVSLVMIELNESIADAKAQEKAMKA